MADVKRCPVCCGKGTVPASFYDTPPPPGVYRSGRTGDNLPVTCRSCGGRGVFVVHDAPPAYVPSYGITPTSGTTPPSPPAERNQ
jgi:hypothetical protein